MAINEVITAFENVIPSSAQRGSRGWVHFNCPSCGDKRKRGRFLITSSDGFRYMCYNGGCQFEDATGWEPGKPLIGRGVRLFELLGGSLSDIPLKFFEASRKLSLPEWIDHMMKEETAGEFKTVTDFPKIDMPPKSIKLWEATSPKARAVQDYVLNRGSIFVDHDFYWNSEYANRVLVPLTHHKKNVGWIGRKITPGGMPHLKCPDFPADFMLNQDQIYRYDVILVLESHFDAIALDALCTFGNTFTQKQINLLNKSKKRKVLLPDYQGKEWRSYWQTAKNNDWSLAIPEWGGNYGPVDHIKDAGESIKRYGVLDTLNRIMSNITDNYSDAANFYALNSTPIEDIE
jgi:hypothetical protein